SIVVLQGCCHNPTGADLSPDQWQELIALFRRQQIIPCIDLAYQGFGQGLEEDAYGIRLMEEAGLNFLVANSYSKNFSYYAERCGMLSVVCSSKKEAELVLGQLIAIARATYSNPPLHGARVIEHILNSSKLRKQWENEVTDMRERIKLMRQGVYQA